jgi:hypothetical protein
MPSGAKLSPKTEGKNSQKSLKIRLFAVILYGTKYFFRVVKIPYRKTRYLYSKKFSGIWSLMFDDFLTPVRANGRSLLLTPLFKRFLGELSLVAV